MGELNAAVRDFVLPDLGEGLEDGEVVAWHVSVGDVVTLNQPIADIETAKAVVTVPSPFAGVVVERLARVGETLAVGNVLVRVDTGSSTADAHRSEADEQEQPRTLVGYGEHDMPSRRHTGGTGGETSADSRSQRPRPLAKPPVRKLARELGIDLRDVAPARVDAIITREDVEHHARAHEHGKEPRTNELTDVGSRPGNGSSVRGFRGREPGDVEEIRGIRRRIVEKMETSRRRIPAASCTREVDLTRIWDLRHTLTAQAMADGYDVKVTPFVLLLRATILGLRRFPTLNARMVGRDDVEIDRADYNGGQIHLLQAINLGIAVDTDRGLVVPNIKDADAKSVIALAVELNRLAQRARDGSIEPGELTGGTFTVNNYGTFGNDDGDPIINHPEGGILGIGAIRLRPWVVDGEVVARRVATLRLAFDHRICDGGEAGRFITYVGSLCEEPTKILLHA
ncbi:MAG: dihydrolipoamide acetyltransferase family protein [Nitriliruptoraceae bacterium]